jgi:tRNA pseudouridine38-40 synthase
MGNRNIRIVIEYDGSRYQGYQRLKNSSNTIQGKIEAVLCKMTGEKIELIASGRTDAGVHAKNQVCNFHTKCKKSVNNIMEYMNGYLPEDIVVKEIKEVNERFHSRYNVKDKTYLYRIWLGNYPPVFQRKYVYHVKDEINIEIMKDASKLFEGEHDFGGFCSRKVKKNTVRIIKSITIKEVGNELQIYVKGNGFLYNMVRIMVGTLIDIGKGKLDKTAITEAINTIDRSKAGEKAPAHGLVLYEVNY